MTLQKALCLICERPTADGAVLAVHVDKDKLQTWFLNFCEHELTDEILDEEKICYFCIWHAEFLWKFNGMSDEDFVWWPRNSDYSDDAAKELRNYYFEGALEQCWVQLEKIELPQSADGGERRNDEAEIWPRRGKCIYCGKRYKYSSDLSKHVKKMHKEAIRCKNQNCVTYFHTLESKDEHNRNIHEKSKEREKLNCICCGKEFEGPKNYNQHVRRVHKDFPIKCSRIGCHSFFKTKIEMKIHFDSVHGNDDMTRKLRCNDCDYKAMDKYHLERHISCKHLPKYLKCKKCEKMFSSESSLRKHVNRTHNFKACTYCKLVVSISYFKSFHLKIKNCSHCKNKFQCHGLYQTHLKSCRKTQFKCDKCSKSFKFKYSLDRHIRKKHKQYM